MKYYNGERFLIDGRIMSSEKRKYAYNRLPDMYKSTLRKELWDLSKNSSGVAIKFITDSTCISVKWSLLNNVSMNHMPDTGIKGVDLYCKSNNGWDYINTGIPNKKHNEQILVEKLKRDSREYVLYLPLYEGTTNVKIGIDENSKIKSEHNSLNPIIFYGTSLTQGGCASRPGLSYTNIISRKLERECVNLGFSGNGHLDESIGEILSKIDTAAFVIECLANLNIDMIQKKTIPLVKTIRKEKPTTPIIFVEQCEIKSSFHKELKEHIIKNNIELSKQLRLMKNENIKEIYLINDNNILNNESTVDGLHFNDIGSMRYANYFVNEIKKLNIL